MLFKHNDKYLHQHFGAALLNDIFGIQSRSGCSCAGPWGHLYYINYSWTYLLFSLLDINEEKSKVTMAFVEKEFKSLKPGWVRLGLHYTMTRYIIQYEYIIYSLGKNLNIQSLPSMASDGLDIYF